MEKMLVCEALDERDFLAKKIDEEIGVFLPMTVVRKKDPKTKSGSTVEEFSQNVLSSYQSIIDKIRRYNRINAAIIASNAVTTITLKAGETMTVAEAISRKNDRHAFDKLLYSRINRIYSNTTMEYSDLVNTYNRKKDQLINTYLTANAGTSTKDSDPDIMISKLVEGDEPVLVDPFKTKTKSIEDLINDLRYNNDNLVKEINAAIKISNATTTIEF